MIKKILGIATVGAIGAFVGIGMCADYVKGQIDVILDSNWDDVDCNSLCDKLLVLSTTKYKLGIDSWNKEKLDLMNELDGADADIDELKDKLRDADADIDELKDKLRDAEADIDELKDKLRDAEAKIEKLKAELNDSENDVLNWKEEAESLGFMLDIAQAERDLYASDLETLQKKNKELQAWKDEYKSFESKPAPIDNKGKTISESMQEIAKAFREALEEL